MQGPGSRLVDRRSTRYMLDRCRPRLGNCMRGDGRWARRLSPLVWQRDWQDALLRHNPRMRLSFVVGSLAARQDEWCALAR